MDDFTFVHPCVQQCTDVWSGSCTDLQTLDFHVSQNIGKTEAPATSKVALGLLIDSVHMTVGLCPVKLHKLAEVCFAMLQMKSVTRKQLEKMLGLFMWVSRVAYAGRTFCHNLQSAMLHLRKPHHRVRMSAWTRPELHWWLTVAPSLDGAHMILPAMPVVWADFQTDASLTGANGQPYIGIWLQGAYDLLSMQQLSALGYSDVPAPDSHISVWEMFAVVMCVRLYADYMRSQYWRVRTVNTQVIAWLMKGDAPPRGVSLWLKEMATAPVHHRFRLGAKHIPGAANCMADALSRCAWQDCSVLLNKGKLTHNDTWVSVAADQVQV